MKAVDGSGVLRLDTFTVLKLASTSGHLTEEEFGVLGRRRVLQASRYASGFEDALQ